MTIFNIILRLLATLAGAAAVIGLTLFLIHSQHMTEAHAIKAWVICGGTITGGVLIARLTGKAKALLILGVLCAESYNIGSVAEQNWRERAAARAEIVQANADAKAAHTAMINAHEAAAARLAKAEAAKAKADDVVSVKNATKECKKDCMAGNLTQAALAAAEVTAARTALAANPKPTSEPAEVNPDAGAVNWQWDIAMGVLGSIGGNLIAIALLSFGASPLPARASHVADGSRNASRHVPTIEAVDVSAADATLLVAANERALSAFRSNLQNVQVSPARSFGEIKAAALAATAERSPLAGLFAGPQPDTGSNRSTAQIVPLFPTPDGSPNGSGGPGGGRRTVRPNDRKGDVLADIQARIDRGERFESQEALRQALSGRFGYLAKSTLSEWLGELEQSITRRQDGRRKVVG